MCLIFRFVKWTVDNLPLNLGPFVNTLIYKVSPVFRLDTLIIECLSLSLAPFCILINRVKFKDDFQKINGDEPSFMKFSMGPILLSSTQMLSTLSSKVQRNQKLISFCGHVQESLCCVQVFSHIVCP